MRRLALSPIEGQSATRILAIYIKWSCLNTVLCAAVCMCTSGPEDLVGVVQQLTLAEQSHCNTIASLSAQLGQLKANQAAIVRRTTHNFS